MFNSKSDQIDKLWWGPAKVNIGGHEKTGFVHCFLEVELKQSCTLIFEKLMIALNLESKRKQILRWNFLIQIRGGRYFKVVDVLPKSEINQQTQ